MDIVCVSGVSNDLGESLYWDVEVNRLYWIDAWKTRIYAFDPVTSEVCCTDLTAALTGLPIGSIARREGGGMISGIRGGFYDLDLEAGSARLVAAVEADRPSTNRLNDGKCDRAGRFWCASLNTDHQTPSGALWRLEGRNPVLMQDGLTVGNGIAWSADDRLMYLADTFTGTVWCYDFDLATGDIANRRPFLSTSQTGGFVDGATIDRDGCYWATLFRGGAIAQFDQDGKLVRRIVLPVSCPTSCVFGGSDLDVLYVTSASRFLDDEQRHAQPDAGCLFAIHGLEARGIAEPRFRA